METLTLAQQPLTRREDDRAEVRIEQPSLHAAALADGDRVVHLSAFEGGEPADERA